MPSEQDSKEVGQTVHLVLTNYDGDPHPHVEAVYDNEEAAEEHRNALTNHASIGGPVAWGTHEVEIRSDIVECPICESDDLKENDHGPLGREVRCRECLTSWRNL